MCSGSNMLRNEQRLYFNGNIKVCFVTGIDAVTSIFLKFGEDIVEYFVYERISAFPHFIFIIFFTKLFLFQSKPKNAVKIK